MQDDELVTRRQYIETWMRQQGIVGEPVRKYVVLRNWCEIVDNDATYEVQVPALPVSGLAGKVLNVVHGDGAHLSLVRVVEDRGEFGLFVEPVNNPNGVQFLVARDDAHVLAIPLRPLAIRRRDLGLYIGDEVANAWHEQRRIHRQASAE